MAARKKPTGVAWDSFLESWRHNTHGGKVMLAETWGVTYDTAKHWVSDAGEASPIPKAPTMRVTVDDLLNTRPAINLDFVCFDIETSNLKADFSILLTGCIKVYGMSAMVFRADSYPDWVNNRADDRAIVSDVAEELRKHAIVVTHFGAGFDIPYLRAKMVKHNLPPLPLMFGIDSWKIAKTNFQVSSRRLKNLASFFDIGEKEQVEGELWMEAAYSGSKEAMDKIVEHNTKDVEVLEKLACLSFPYLKSIPKL